MQRNFIIQAENDIIYCIDFGQGKDIAVKITYKQLDERFYKLISAEKIEFFIRSLLKIFKGFLFFA